MFEFVGKELLIEVVPASRFGLLAPGLNALK
jgi:hypothetical protein